MNTKPEKLSLDGFYRSSDVDPLLDELDDLRAAAQTSILADNVVRDIASIAGKYGYSGGSLGDFIAGALAQRKLYAEDFNRIHEACTKRGMDPTSTTETAESWIKRKLDDLVIAEEKLRRISVMVTGS